MIGGYEFLTIILIKYKKPDEVKDWLNVIVGLLKKYPISCKKNDYLLKA